MSENNNNVMTTEEKMKELFDLMDAKAAAGELNEVENDEKFDEEYPDSHPMMDEILYKLQKFVVRRWLLDEGKKEVYKNAQWVCAKVESDITVVLNDGRIQFRKYIPDNELISTFNKRYKSRSLNDTERLKYYIEDI